MARSKKRSAAATAELVRKALYRVHVAGIALHGLGRGVGMQGDAKLGERLESAGRVAAAAAKAAQMGGAGDARLRELDKRARAVLDDNALVTTSPETIEQTFVAGVESYLFNLAQAGDTGEAVFVAARGVAQLARGLFPSETTQWRTATPPKEVTDAIARELRRRLPSIEQKHLGHVDLQGKRVAIPVVARERGDVAGAGDRAVHAYCRAILRACGVGRSRAKNFPRA